jgi:hypothetical protein
MPGPAGDGDPKPVQLAPHAGQDSLACPPWRVRTPRRLPRRESAAPDLNQQRSEIEARDGTAANGAVAERHSP